MLTHIGRKKGKPHERVIEVVKHDRQSGTCFAVSGWGEKADWYRNNLKEPQVTIRVGTRRLRALAEPLPPAEAVQIFKEYVQAPPLAFKEIGRFFSGPSVSLDDEAIEGLSSKLPMVEFQLKHR